MEMVRWIFQVDRHEINYLSVIIESYDGAAIVRTIDPEDAMIEIEISPSCEEIMTNLLKSLREIENITLDPISLTQPGIRNEI